MSFDREQNINIPDAENPLIPGSPAFETEKARLDKAYTEHQELHGEDAINVAFEPDGNAVETIDSDTNPLVPGSVAFENLDTDSKKKD